MMLDHRVDGNGLRTFEELGKHAYPSAPNESFQAIILGKIPSLGFKKSSKDLEVDFCELLINIWANCAKEEHVCCPNYSIWSTNSFLVCTCISVY